jgi:hypothetical protein
MRNTTPIVFALLAFGMLSCEKNNLGSIDTNKEVPQLSNASVAPDSIYIDNLTPVGDRYQISAGVRVTATVGTPALPIVTATLLRPNSPSVFQELTLSSSSGNVFNGQAQFSISRAQAGKYRIQFSAKTTDGLQGNTLEMPLKLGRRNSVPRLLNLSAPDSISVPFGGSVIVQMTIAASDSDGLADIRQVYFRSLTSRDTVTRFFMKDDGGLDAPQFPSFPRSGDESAGDGIYSIKVPVSITDTTQYRLNVFAFKTEDVYGDTSATLAHNFRVKRP